MSLTPDAARSCAGCSTLLDSGSSTCSRCGEVHGVVPVPPAVGPGTPPPVPPPYGYPARVVQVVAPKSPGIAVVLSIWLGVGHLYVGVNGLGFCLLAFYLFLCLLSFVPILWVLTIPVWFVSFIFVAMNASKAAHDFNRRNGLVVR
jgi:hypothetical protein